MNARTFVLLGVAVGLALVLTAAVAAQGPGDGAPHTAPGGETEHSPHSPSFALDVRRTLGALQSQMYTPDELDLYRAGNAHVTDIEKYRVQEFAQSLSGWKQVNSDGFGDPRNTGAQALEAF